jgi:4-hydroxybenzoate polyprenyltransferase
MHVLQTIEGEITMNGRYDIMGLTRLVSGSPLLEALVGLAVLALAIIGLAHIYPWLLASIATIALGAAFVFESGAIGKRFSMLARDDRTGAVAASATWGGITAGFLAGCAGIALGILSLLHIRTTVLVPVAVILYGAGLIADSLTRLHLSALENEQAGLRGVPLKVAGEQATIFWGHSDGHPGDHKNRSCSA